MKCPKCRNDSPDGSEYCPVCYEVLVQKPARPVESSPASAPPAAGGGSDWFSRIAVVAAGVAVAYWLIGGLLPGGRGGQMPVLSLPTRDSSARVALNECPTSKCLTVYVAPWCPHCRGASPLISAVREDVAKRGVTTRIVVGMDQEQAVVSYAEQFGPDTLLDLGSEFKFTVGVPAVFVSDARGVISKMRAGLPEISPPSDAAELREIESTYFGVP
ncbi:MAG: hypothetical protein ACHQ49_06630 [Elusimicrobiota bacterium]